MEGRSATSPPGFDFSTGMHRLCQDLIDRLEELQHIHMDEVLVAFAQARRGGRHGLYASLTPLRFEGGARTGRVSGRPVRVQPVRDAGGREMLYILRFYLPRFCNLEFREKLVTILHELWHIGPDFDGDLRRFDGRCYMHSGSQARYDREMGEMADRVLERTLPASVYGFLRQDFGQLRRRFGSVYGHRIAQPRLIPHTGTGRTGVE